MLNFSLLSFSRVSPIIIIIIIIMNFSLLRFSRVSPIIIIIIIIIMNFSLLLFIRVSSIIIIIIILNFSLLSFSRVLLLLLLLLLLLHWRWRLQDTILEWPHTILEWPHTILQWPHTILEWPHTILERFLLLVTSWNSELTCRLYMSDIIQTYVWSSMSVLRKYTLCPVIGNSNRYKTADVMWSKCMQDLIPAGNVVWRCGWSTRPDKNKSCCWAL
jgi:hypothetical protein